MAAFHRQHHHGPYLFQDAPGYAAALPANGYYVAMEHSTPPHAPAPLSPLVPSLTSGIAALSKGLRGTSSALRDSGARQRVRVEFGTSSL